ncbi:uncharacterized protein CLAFUR5_10717 [Fulvia fulva]|uniref:Uncharacterized protein n=1 Tax=Passalora fulva TaxID=5499 RepID=A0A9Q8URH2_PASFU|nr:uncharacterized protein CLAFUR5_10717 [Fulvia fulva]KAK4620717.1 hypothetical protein CLAFUR0_11687 [Fulvia fulva]UJO19748.1 hypothetical protein CLAFUR5_10717 [Fulvia fulva]WPV32537.1 hypothetical protein CLAFUW7_11677 [Fulvia fulva]
MSSPDLDAVEQALGALTINTSDSTAIATLAQASKEHPAVRTRLASPEAIKSLVETIESSLTISPSTVQAALRCLGNACIDNNDARGVITGLGFTSISQCLATGNDQTQLLATKVLYNICNDYEPAQQQVYKEKLDAELVRYCSSKFALEESEHNACAIDVLFWATGHKATVEPTLGEPLPADLLVRILLLPQLYGKDPQLYGKDPKGLDVEKFGSVANVTLVFLQDTTVQKQLIEGKKVNGIWNILEIADAKASMLKKSEREEDKEDLKALQPLSNSLVWCLSDVAANEEFTKFYPLDGSDMKFFLDYIMAVMTAEGGVAMVGDELVKMNMTSTLVTAACQVIGNALWALPLESYEYLVTEENLHDFVFAIVWNRDLFSVDKDLLHSAAGLLTQLTRPSVTARERIGKHPASMQVLERLCRHDMPEIKQDGLKLLKALGKECPTIQEKFKDLAVEVMKSLQEGRDTETAEAAPS